MCGRRLGAFAAVTTAAARGAMESSVRMALGGNKGGQGVTGAEAAATLAPGRGPPPSPCPSPHLLDEPAPPAAAAEGAANEPGAVAAKSAPPAALEETPAEVEVAEVEPAPAAEEAAHEPAAVAEEAPPVAGDAPTAGGGGCSSRARGKGSEVRAPGGRGGHNSRGLSGGSCASAGGGGGCS